jgi:FtsH-binding integral membrane protein
LINPATPEDPQRTTVWRSRAFVKALLVTIVGVGAPPAVLLAWSYSIGRASDPCTGTSCGYGIGVALVYGILFVAVWCAVMLMTGFIVGRSSRGTGLAFRAILVAVVGLALTVSILYMTYSTTSESFLDTVFMFLGLAIGPLIPVGLGFLVGRSVRGTPDVSVLRSAPSRSRQDRSSPSA